MAADFVQMSLLEWGGLCTGLVVPGELAATTPADPDQEFIDGITTDRFETFEVAQIKKFKDTCKISLAQGDSGKWYCGWDAYCAKAQCGTGFAAWPKFSDTFDTKYQAFEEAMLKAEYWLIEQGAKLESTNAIRCHLKTFLRDIDPVQYHRDQVCGEWRSGGLYRPAAATCYGSEAISR